MGKYCLALNDIVFSYIMTKTSYYTL